MDIRHYVACALKAEAACVLNMATRVGTFSNLADPPN